MSEVTTKSPANAESVFLDTPNEGDKSTVIDLMTCTLEDFDKEVLGDNKKLRDDWLAAGPDTKDEGFIRINKMLKEREEGTYTTPEGGPKPSEKQGGKGAEGGSENPPETGSEQGGENQVEETVEVNGLKISKSLLGTFLVNHEPLEAVKLALEAQQNGQRFIDDLKPRYYQLQDTTTNLRQQLIDAQNKIDGLKRAAKEAKPLERQSINIPEIDSIDFDSLDAYDPTAMGELIENVKGAKQKIADLNKGVEGSGGQQAQQQPSTEQIQPSEGGTQSPPAQQQDSTTGSTSPVVQEQLDALYDAALDREFDEIADLQRAIPVLRTTISYKDLDTKVANFQSSVAAAAGLNPKSRTDMVKAYSTYFSQTPEGEQLRALCEVRGVKPPKEIEKWSEIMKIRKVRNANIAERAREIEGEILKHTGRTVKQELYQIKPIKGNTYLDLYKSANPIDVNKIALESKIKGHQEAATRASASSQSHVPEPGPDTGTQPPSPAGAMSEEDLTKLFIKYRDNPNSVTSDEAKFMLEVAKANSFDSRLLDDLIKRAKG